MPTPFSDEELVEAGGEKLRLLVNFRAIDVIEGLVDEPMPTVLARLFSPPAPIGLQGKVLWALLRAHHPTVTLDEAAGLMFGDDAAKVGQAMAVLLQRAFKLDGKAEDENPPERPGASEPS